MKDLRGFVWCVGIVLGALDLNFSHVAYWDGLTYKGHDRGVIQNGCLIVSMCLAAIAYLVGIIGSRNTSDAVQQRLWNYVFF